MKSIEAKIGRVIIGKVEPDEDLIESIIEMVQNHKIQSGLINCIGALKKFTLGYFNLDTKSYERKVFEENIELVSCMGNIAFLDGEPIIHLHISIGNRDYSVMGGHLFQPAIVSITGEVYIFEIDKKLYRESDLKFNLSLLNL
ncbi:MAG: PPC domain-containing DNA-binding protein [Promethearchaeota archaeon]|jgi:predicted DNA-binding protein with PD1-like motif